MVTKRKIHLEETIENVQRRWEDCMGEANDDVGEVHRLYIKKGSTKLSDEK